MHHPFSFPRLAAVLCLGVFFGLAGLSAPAAAGASESLPSISAPKLLELVRANPGKVIFINFFASWCPPCREEIPDLIRLRKEYPEQDLLLVGVSLDEDAAKLAAFAAETNFNYPVYRAEDDIPPLFGIMSIPYNVVYDAAGSMVVSEAGMIDAASLRTFFDALFKEAKTSTGKAQGVAK